MYTLNICKKLKERENMFDESKICYVTMINITSFNGM